MGELAAREHVAVKIAAITGLTIICVAALHYGIDHVVVATISAIIGGIAGYELKALRVSGESA